MIHNGQKKNRGIYVVFVLNTQFEDYEEKSNSNEKCVSSENKGKRAY